VYDRFMLEIRGLSKRFGGAAALEDVSLAMAPGEFFSLLGPSGCGKTTLLRILAGFESASAGTVKLDGENLLAQPAHRRDCNMIFQRYALFPHLDVRANVAFGLTVKKIEPKEIAHRVDEALALVDMTGFESRMTSTLSGGQQQRVAIARAVVNRPKLLLLDEPLSALDLKLRQKMQVELRGLQKKLGIGFVYVTHAQDEALSMSDRVAIMNRGRVDQVATPAEIYDQPATAFVATFIGQMNRLPGKRQADQGGYATFALADGKTLKAKAPQAAGDGKRLTLMVRLERTRLGPGPADNRLEATVKQLVFRGATIDLIAEVHAAPGVTFTTQLARDGGSLPEVGQEVELGFAADDARLVPDEVQP
jgi:spermidine/putrescine transport system ATP-binding protein